MMIGHDQLLESDDANTAKPATNVIEKTSPSAHDLLNLQGSDNLVSFGTGIAKEASHDVSHANQEASHDESHANQGSQSR
jgi:hypothetical protein